MKERRRRNKSEGYIVQLVYLIFTCLVTFSRFLLSFLFPSFFFTLSRLSFTFFSFLLLGLLLLPLANGQTLSRALSLSFRVSILFVLYHLPYVFPQYQLILSFILSLFLPPSRIHVFHSRKCYSQFLFTWISHLSLSLSLFLLFVY